MPERDSEVYSNPLPPSMQQDDDEDDAGMSAHPLTNDDFRKLMMTPRMPGGQMPPSTLASGSKHATEHKETDDVASERKKKKSYYAKLKKLEEDRQKELAEKYRDRARERRDGTNNDYEQTKMISTTADYRAVAPDAQAGEHYAERRKQLIQESKYLGGDMEHTHLVKGLDYALLEKVRAEISSKEIEEEEEMEAVLESRPSKPEKEEEPDEPQFKTRLGKNVYRQLFRTKPPERNELFLPGRMAYVVDLEDDIGESDIPTTLIRSKADCPTLESTTTLTTNDIVINKLTQILSYLRQGKREAKKLKKKDKGKLKEEERPKLVDDSIYGDLGDYNPSYGKGKERSDRDKERDRRDRDRRDRDRDRDHRDRTRDHGRDREREKGRDVRGDRGRDRDRERDRDRDRDRERDRGGQEREREKKSYFEKPVEEDDERVADRGSGSAKELVQSINQRFGKLAGPSDDSQAMMEAGEKEKKPKEDGRINKLKKKQEIDSYAECYPGMMESADAIDDSDDEVDYMKMDQGNKKGPVGRWDFDTQEEYSDYMSSKEALPKAAFQYGVKMADGRKTRRTGPKDDKKKVDREWQKIQNIIAKRKNMGTGGGPSSKSGRYN